MELARVHPGTPAGRAVARVLASLEAADSLPGPADVWIAVPPVGSAYARKAEGFNPWLVFRIGPESAFAMIVTTQPPIPVTDE